MFSSGWWTTTTKTTTITLVMTVCVRARRKVNLKSTRRRIVHISVSQLTRSSSDCVRRATFFFFFLQMGHAFQCRCAYIQLRANQASKQPNTTYTLSILPPKPFSSCANYLASIDFTCITYERERKRGKNWNDEGLREKERGRVTYAIDW